MLGFIKETVELKIRGNGFAGCRPRREDTERVE